MCLIIASQNGVLPSTQLLKDAYKDNPDGWGLMWAENGRINVVKGLRLKSMIRNVLKMEGKPFVLHTRWATHGKVGVSNCHPFKVTDDLWIAHNGVITIDLWKKGMSDTWHFARALKSVAEECPFILEREYRAQLTKYVKDWIGLRNKIVMLRADGEIRIANEEAGVQYEGMWLSNSNSLWRSRTPESWVSRPQYKPSHHYDAMLAAFEAQEVEVEYPSQQQCDFCCESAARLFSFEESYLCSLCFDSEIEFLLKNKDDVEENDADEDDFETGLEDTELGQEIGRIRASLAADLTRGDVVTIGQEQYMFEQVPF
jgi:predicted glutamine amidotransferase